MVYLYLNLEVLYVINILFAKVAVGVRLRATSIMVANGLERILLKWIRVERYRVVFSSATSAKHKIG